MGHPLRREPERDETVVASAALFDGVPLPSRMRPGPPLDPAADWAAFVRLVRPLLAQAPESGRLRAARLAEKLGSEPAPLDAAEAAAWASDLLAVCPGLDQRLSYGKTRQDSSMARAVWGHLASWLVARSGAAALTGCLDVLVPRRGGGDGIQTLRTLTLQDGGRDSPSTGSRFGDLDAATASEILRAPSLLVAAGAD